MVDRMTLRSAHVTQEQIARLRVLFPHCVTEARGARGEVVLGVDFERLKQELSDVVIEGPQERYRLEWPGKREALLVANEPVTKTLRPCREESVAFDTTQNLFIEGDNLDVLKLLQESYLGKVKLIYIDPPYNTGKDFIYKDSFSDTVEGYKGKSFQKDDEGNRLVSNPETLGRFHSNWLSMMYPRLKLAKNLLSDEGVIFISIDDNEVTNTQKLLEDIFGIENFVAKLVWRRRASSALSDNNVSINHEYVICYQRGGLKGFKGLVKDFANYANPDNDPRGLWTAGDLTVGMSESLRPNQAYALVDPSTGNRYPHNPDRVWAYAPTSMAKLVAEGRVIFPTDTSRRPMLKRFKNELKSITNPFPSIMNEIVGINTEATRDIKNIFGSSVFEYSKPLSLMCTLVAQVTEKEDIILDFFAGSGTTAHAVMAQNAKDGGNRRFIQVQIPEKTPEMSEACKAGYKTIAELSRERICRAGGRILEEECHEGWKKDVGFRVLKLDSSTMEEVFYCPKEFQQTDLLHYISPIKKDRSDEDLLFHVMLDWGMTLTLPVILKEYQDQEGRTSRVYHVDGNALLACFEKEISERLMQDLARLQPRRMVFWEESFFTDAARINVEQIFRQLSPATKLKIL